MSYNRQIISKKAMRVNFQGFTSDEVIYLKIIEVVTREEFEELKKNFLLLSKKVEAYLLNTLITWASISDVASEHRLSPDAIRKRLKNGDFEEGIDFKKNGGKILVHQRAIGRLQRQRRSNNG